MQLRTTRAGEPGSPVPRGRARGRPGPGLRALVTAIALGAALWTATTPAPADADVFAGFATPAFSVAPGDTFTAYLVIEQAGDEFNAFDASMRFDPALLSFEAITPVSAQRGDLMVGACSNTFHRFDAAPDSLKITLSLLCSNTFVTGPGTIYRVRFRAGLTEAVTTITLGAFTEFYRAGLFVRPLHKGSMTVTIGSPVGVEPAKPAGRALELAPPAPNPRRGSSSVTLDFSLPAPDVVRIELLDVQGRLVAARPVERLAEGRHRLAWSPPGLAAGVYTIRLSAARAGSATRRWSVLR